MKLFLNVLVSTSLLLLGASQALCDNISDIVFDPAPPAALVFGDNVNITFNYETTEASGVRIFARPFTGGSLTPGYGASGSPVYSGSGSASGSFTISAGAVVVDQVRFQILTADQTSLLLEFFVPVRFQFSSHAVTNIGLAPGSPAPVALDDDVDVTFDYETTQAGGVRIFVRPFSGGALAPSYAAHGSPLYPTGTGVGSGFFTITAGNVVVDELRIQMWNSDQSVLLLELFLPVEYSFQPNGISNIQLAPGPVASFVFGDPANLTFDYVNAEAGGVRIFARPFTNGSLSPNYGAHGSPLYPQGSGSGSGNFTISTGSTVVDSIRIQMWDASQSTLLFETFVPVEYHFSSHAVTNLMLVPSTPANFAFGQQVSVTFDYETDEGSGVRIFLRPFTVGALTPNYSAHGSPLYAVGSGSGSGSFTITSGDAVVDHIRVQMFNATQSALLLEFFLPVRYTFGNAADVDEEASEGIRPTAHWLDQNYPNPFNPETTIRYVLPQAAPIRLTVYNVLGERVRTLVDGISAAGQFEVRWDGRDDRGTQLASGLYLLRLESRDVAESRKMLLLR